MAHFLFTDMKPKPSNGNDAPQRWGVVSATETRREIQRAKRKNVRVFVIHCKKYGSYRDLLRAMARDMSFPAYFGVNWDALVDCLVDVTWLPGEGTLIVFEGADHLLELSTGELKKLLDIFDGADPNHGFRDSFLRVLFVGSATLAGAFAALRRKKSR